jgi:hypothetical protein
MTPLPTYEAPPAGQARGAKWFFDDFHTNATSCHALHSASRT